MKEKKILTRGNRTRGFHNHQAHVDMISIVGLLVLGAQVQQRPPIAKTPMDVVKTTASSFFTLGGVGFAITSFQESAKRANVAGQARTRVPYFVFQASLAQAKRIGLVSAGFTGGRALGQVIRGKDDSTCAMMGSIFGGIAASPTVAGIPGSIATFACFGYFIESFTAGKRPLSPEEQLAKAQLQRTKLQKQLAAVDAEIGQLQAA